MSKPTTLPKTLQQAIVHHQYHHRQQHEQNKADHVQAETKWQRRAGDHHVIRFGRIIRRGVLPPATEQAIQENHRHRDKQPPLYTLANCEQIRVGDPQLQHSITEQNPRHSQSPVE